MLRTLFTGMKTMKLPPWSKGKQAMWDKKHMKTVNFNDECRSTLFGHYDIVRA